MTSPAGERPSSGRSGDELTGRTLAGRYLVGERIGSGGAADVLRAVDTVLGRSVAVKVFRPDGGPQLRRGVEDEADLLARLDHPGLVGVHGAGLYEGRPYVVMGLVDGVTLDERLRDGVLHPGAVVRLGEQLASVLAHVHGAGIVHLDVKPSNILLDRRGHPHLVDFGIARRIGAPHPAGGAGVLSGTAAYMSPEQVNGDPPGPPSDVWSLGLVLLECLTGELAYTGTPLESAVARLHRAPAVPDGLSGALRGLLTEMTGTAPRNRPTARACAERLRSGPAGTGHGTVAPQRRRKRPAAPPSGPRQVTAPLFVPRARGTVRADGNRASRWRASRTTRPMPPVP
ncbi:serine/threonine-protein kinase [Streptomyces sp. TR02-1]|uniref:serine/threonine-protein kinase n=1 Tax=Streptomyces sp. TR02-1 TaxID=3385977 RepID=UPI00399F03FE